MRQPGQPPQRPIPLRITPQFLPRPEQLLLARRIFVGRVQLSHIGHQDFNLTEARCITWFHRESFRRQGYASDLGTVVSFDLPVRPLSRSEGDGLHEACTYHRRMGQAHVLYH
jgi:hypothetical protein